MKILTFEKEIVSFENIFHFIDLNQSIKRNR
jgi:hypothetical protein